MASSARTLEATPTPVLRPPRRNRWDWIGLLPFLVFSLLFLLIPSLSLFIGAFLDRQGNFTLQNILDLTQPPIPESYWLSIRVSLVTAVLGGVFGFLVAYAVTIGGLSRWFRGMTMTICGVSSNFAGVPLAFAFIATLGRVGFVTVMLKNFGINLYDAGFNLYSFVGLSLTYLFFQLPLMVLIMAPSLDGLKREWREAAENLGASPAQYWRLVALPVLMPALLGGMILLFGNAFGAYATAYALTGGTLNLVTIQIGVQMRGDVFNNPGLGYAMALGMVAIMAVSIILYTWLQRRAERWVK